MLFWKKKKMGAPILPLQTASTELQDNVSIVPFSSSLVAFCSRLASEIF